MVPADKMSCVVARDCQVPKSVLLVESLLWTVVPISVWHCDLAGFCSREHETDLVSLVLRHQTVLLGENEQFQCLDSTPTHPTKTRLLNTATVAV